MKRRRDDEAGPILARAAEVVAASFQNRREAADWHERRCRFRQVAERVPGRGRAAIPDTVAAQVGTTPLTLVAW